MTDDPILDAALERLRGNTTGDLRFDEHVRGVRYVLDHDGRMVLPVMVAMLRTPDTVLFVPELADEAMELMLTLEPFEEIGAGAALADRWRIHHGDPPDVRWARAVIDAARHETSVIDGEALQVPNPLAAAEPALCRLGNGELRAALPAICRRFAGVGVDEPRLVSVDPGGANLRGRFGVYRARFPAPAPEPAAAQAALEAMAREALADAIEAEPEQARRTAGDGAGTEDERDWEGGIFG